MLFSGMDVTDTEGTVGLYVHELLHNLGVGNTDKHASSEHVPLLCSEHVPLLCTTPRLATRRSGLTGMTTSP